mmetsp:Transcript_23457/g.34884  ORF Transcript_23457/g.34884 Transcript_23457/m.34884 type:complete len:339 (-) Transcript_23457:263-1279(-)
MKEQDNIQTTTRKRSSDHGTDNLSDVVKNDRYGGEIQSIHKKIVKVDPKTTGGATRTRTKGAMLPGETAVVQEITPTTRCEHDDATTTIMVVAEDDTNKKKDMVVSRTQQILLPSCADHVQNVVLEKESVKEVTTNGTRSLMYQQRLAQNRKTAQRRRDRNRKYLHDLSCKRDQLSQLNFHLKNENILIKHQISLMAKMLVEEQEEQRKHQQAQIHQYQQLQEQYKNLQVKQDQMVRISPHQHQQKSTYVQKYGEQESLREQQPFVSSLQYVKYPGTAKHIFSVPAQKPQQGMTTHSSGRRTMTKQFCTTPSCTSSNVSTAAVLKSKEQDLASNNGTK